MKIVVTGALGYVGSALIRRLPAVFPQAHIILLDNLSTGQLHALKELPRRGHYQFLEADIRRFDMLKLRLTSKDTVIHLAGLSRPGDSYERPEEFRSVNLDGALRTAQACAKTSTPFFFPSTTSVYHQTSGKVIAGYETHLKPQTPYAATKLKAEQGLHKIKDLRYTTVRFGTIFGVSPVFSVQTAVNKFCWQASTGQPITVWKTALRQLRPYLAIEDALGLILFLIKEKHFDGNIYHAATCHAAVQDVLAILKHRIPSIEICLQKAAAMNRLSYKIDCRDILRLGFKFRGDLAQSITKILGLFSKFPKQSLRQA